MLPSRSGEGPWQQKKKGNLPMEVKTAQAPVIVPKKRPNAHIGGGYWPYAFLAPYVLCYATFSLFPIIYSFVISLSDWQGIGPMKLIGFDNYVRILSGGDPYFWKSVLNTLILFLMSTPLAIIMGLVIAVFLFNIPRGRNVLQTLNFLPYVTTPVAIGLIFGFLFNRTDGQINGILQALGLIDEGIYWLGHVWTARFVVMTMVVWKNTGYYMMMYLSGLAAVPAELYEAAKVDGANSPQTFWHVTLPQLKPITTFLMMTAAIGGLQMFEEPNLVFSTIANNTGGPERCCMTAVWHFYNVAFKQSTKLGYGSAIAFCLFVIICSLTILSNKLTGRRGATM